MARVICINITANITGLNIIHRLGQRLDQWPHEAVFFLDQIKRCAARGARPKPRQFSQQADQTFYFGAGGFRGHKRSRFGLTIKQQKPAAMKMR